MKILRRICLALICTAAIAHEKHENQSNSAKISSNEKQVVNCELKESRCAIALLSHSKGRIKLINVPETLKRRPAHSSTEIVLKAIAIEKQFEGLHKHKEEQSLSLLNFNHDENWFKQLALTIGTTNLNQLLDSWRYGNKQLFDKNQQFKPQDLQINTVEQVKFLKRVLTNEKVSSAKTKNMLSNMFQQHESLKHVSILTFQSKTPSELSPLTWSLGWIKQKNETYYFAYFQQSSNPEKQALGLLRSIDNYTAQH